MFYEAILDNLNEYSDIQEKFDIISMFEVFEHIKNPNQNFKSNKLLLSNRT
jgi:2-polyprenyl-3-methyl-5-hydroxy-6-metoxy-1,4-benzoquinol methylase